MKPRRCELRQHLMSVDWCRDLAVTIREVSTLMNNIFPDRTIANVRFTVCVLSSTICRGPTEFSKTLPDWGFTPLQTMKSSHQHCRVEIAAHQSHVWNILQNELTWGQVGFSTCGVSIVWFISLHLTLLHGSREVESKKNGDPADLNPRASVRREWILNLRFFYLLVETERISDLHVMLGFFRMNNFQRLK